MTNTKTFPAPVFITPASVEVQEKESMKEKMQRWKDNTVNHMVDAKDRAVDVCYDHATEKLTRVGKAVVVGGATAVVAGSVWAVKSIFFS